jgi:hypothetical protein
VVEEHEADHAVLDQDVADATVGGIAVPEANELGRTRRLAAKEVDGN